MESTRERAVAGITNGRIGLHQEVTWEAVHFGIRQRLASRITAFEPPHWFQDCMVQGAFKRFCHDHLFEYSDNVTTMTDVFDDTSPLGPLGRIANALFVDRYLRRLLGERAAVLRRAAESHGR